VLIFGLSGGLILELIWGAVERMWILVLMVGLVGGLVDALRFTRIGAAIEGKKSRLSATLVVGLSGGLIGRWIGEPNQGVRNGLIVGLIVGLIIALRRGKQSLENDIHTVESLGWSWASARQGGMWGLMWALVGALVVLLTLGRIKGESAQPLTEWIRVPVTRLSGGLIGMFVGGLTRKAFKEKAAPNQGIKLSMRNMAFVGLLGGLLFSLVGAGIAEIAGKPIHPLYGWRYGVSIGLTVGLVGSLWYGGFDIIQHYTLRGMLYLKGYTPCHYVHFLDYAAERVFLYKVGGGYKFIHPLFLEHCAAMDATAGQAPQ
jgi:hypothetical protein